MSTLRPPEGRPPRFLAAAAAAATRCSASRLPANCSVSRLALFVVLIATAVLVSFTFDAQKIEGLLVWVQDNPAQGSVLFLCVYTAGVILMFPAMVMAMAAGAVFGMVAGTLLVWVGSSVGQTIAFVIGRYLLRELVVTYLTQQFPKWTAIDKAMETEGWKLVTLLRLSPIAPWNVLNYALSVTAVPLAPYCAASSLAILPYLILFVYFGSLARNLADIFTGKAGLGTNGTIVAAVVSGVLMVVIVWYTTHLSRKAISNALLTSGDETTVEACADTDVAELLRVNSGEALAAAEHLHSPVVGSGRAAAAARGSLFAGSPRDQSIELVVAAGGSAGKGTPPGAGQPSSKLSKKHTPASGGSTAAGETSLLLDRSAEDSAAGSGASRPHLRASHTGGGGHAGNSSASTPNGLSPLSGARGRLQNAL